MKHSIIKDFSNWLNESVQTVNEAGNEGAIALVSASTSKTNVQQDLSKEMGTSMTMSYTVTFSNVYEFLQKLKDSGGKKSFTGVIDLSKTTPTKPGTDILTINDKTINETGTLLLLKKDLTGPITATFSNNGALCLLRLGQGLLEANAGQFKDWAIKLTLGGNDEESNSRGYNTWTAKPGQNESIRHTIVKLMAMVILKFSNNEDLIAKNDTVYGNYYKLIQNTKTSEEAIKAILDSEVKDLTQLKMMANPNPDQSLIKISDFITNIGSYLRDTGTQSRYAQSKKIKATTPAGAAKIIELSKQFAAAIAPTQTPDGWTGSESIISQYAEIVKNIVSINGSGLVDQCFTDVQADHQYQDAPPPKPGAAAATSTSHKEGEL